MENLDVLCTIDAEPTEVGKLYEFHNTKAHIESFYVNEENHVQQKRVYVLLSHLLHYKNQKFKEITAHVHHTNINEYSIYKSHRFNAKDLTADKFEMTYKIEPTKN